MIVFFDELGTSEIVKKAHYDVRDGQKAHYDIRDGKKAYYDLRVGQKGSL